MGFRIPTHQWSTAGQALAAAVSALVVAFLLAGCGSVEHAPTAAAPPERVWPEAPAEPRVRYQQSIHSPRDAGLSRVGSSWVTRWLFNEDKMGGHLVRPFGLGLDESGNLCIADPGLPAVLFLDQGRKTWESWNKLGSLELVAPVGVAKHGGIFYVADSGLGELLAFNAKGKLLFHRKEGLERPSGVAVLGDRLFVADAAAHKIVVLDLTGKFVSSFGSRGTGPGEFNYPTHIATDLKGRLFVTDSMNFRIQIFDAQGQYLKAFGKLGDASGTLSRPKGLAVDRFGDVWLVDALFDNVQIFTEAGDFLLALGEHGDGPGGFWLPAGIAISGDDLVYVADSYNRRIQVFKLLPQP